MLARPGWALLGVLVPATPLLILSPLGPYGAWALVAAALWLGRSDPDLAPRVPLAFAVLAATIVLGLLAAGVTVGTGAGPLFTSGGEGGALGAIAFFGPGMAPAAVLLAGSADRPVRGLARAALWLIGLAALLLLAMVLWPPSVADGTAAQQTSLLLLDLAFVYLLILAAFAVPLGRATLAWARDRPAAEA